MPEAEFDLSYLREDALWQYRFYKNLTSAEDEAGFYRFYESLWSLKIGEIIGGGSNFFVANHILIPFDQKPETRLVHLAALTRHLVLRKKSSSMDCNLPKLLDANLLPTDATDITYLRHFYLMLNVVFPCFFDCLTKNKAKQLVIDICAFLEGSYLEIADHKFEYKLTKKNKSVKQREALYQHVLKQHTAVPLGRRLLDLSPFQLAAVFEDEMQSSAAMCNYTVETQIEDIHSRNDLYENLACYQAQALSADDFVKNLFHAPLPGGPNEMEHWLANSSILPTSEEF